MNGNLSLRLGNKMTHRNVQSKAKANFGIIFHFIVEDPKKRWRILMFVFFFPLSEDLFLGGTLGRTNDNKYNNDDRINCLSVCFFGHCDYPMIHMQSS